MCVEYSERKKKKDGECVSCIFLSNELCVYIIALEDEGIVYLYIYMGVWKM